MNKETRDKVKTWAAILPFVFMAIGGYAQIKEQLATISSRVDNVTAANERSLQVFEELASSINKLSESVARLDERTKALEQE